MNLKEHIRENLALKNLLRESLTSNDYSEEFELVEFFSWQFS